MYNNYNSYNSRKLFSSKIGVVFHTKYSGNSLASLSKSSDVNVSEFTPSADVWFDDAKFKDISGVVTLTEDETNNVNALINKDHPGQKVQIKANGIPISDINLTLKENNYIILDLSKLNLKNFVSIEFILQDAISPKIINEAADMFKRVSDTLFDEDAPIIKDESVRD